MHLTKKFVLIQIFILISSLVWSQSDTLNIDVHSFFTLSSQNEQPLWLTANKQGVLSGNSNNAVLALPMNYKRMLGKNLELVAGFYPAFRNSGAYEFESGTSVYLVEYFSKFSYGKTYLRLGAEGNTIGQFGSDLSSGSLAQTLNARPIPRISFGTEYFNVPFTKGHVQVKGELSHGWVEKQRRVQNPWLHQKFAYIKLGAKLPVSVEFGLVHNAMWGGELDGVKSRFILSDYKNVMFGGITDPNSTNVGSRDTYVFGFHTGTIDFAINIESSWFDAVVYAQKPWEDSEQISRHSFFIKYFDNNDGLFGLHLKPKSSLIEAITIEHIQTKFQGGPGLPDPPPFVDDIGEQDPDGCLHNQCEPYARRENYHNNFIYQNGWTYYNRTLATPLFTHQRQIVNLLGNEDLGEVYGRNTVYNNRIEGFHLGVSGKLNQRNRFSFKYTFTKNYGNYFAQFGRGYNADFTGWSSLGETYYFDNGVDQSYLLLQLNHSFKKNPLELELATGADFGRINNSYGILLGIKYNYVSINKRN